MHRAYSWQWGGGELEYKRRYCIQNGENGGKRIGKEGQHKRVECLVFYALMKCWGPNKKTIKDYIHNGVGSAE